MTAELKRVGVKWENDQRNRRSKDCDLDSQLPHNDESRFTLTVKL